MMLLRGNHCPSTCVVIIQQRRSGGIVGQSQTPPGGSLWTEPELFSEPQGRPPARTERSVRVRPKTTCCSSLLKIHKNQMYSTVEVWGWSATSCLVQSDPHVPIGANVTLIRQKEWGLKARLWYDVLCSSEFEEISYKMEQNWTSPAGCVGVLQLEHTPPIL